MKINILDINKLIKNKNLQEVKNPIFFNLRNTPTEDGLFSYEIFGPLGSDERKYTYAYIDLHSKFIHPMVYKLITSLGSRYADCISGNKYYKVVNNDLVEDSENGRTGLDFFYEAFDNLKFKSTDSSKREEKLDVLNSLSKNEIFIDKYIVIPAFLRDFNPNKTGKGSSDVDMINNIYSKIIRLSQSLNDGSFSFVSNSTKNSIQTYLVEIYENLISSLASKTGLIHQSLLGKNVDYATRSVISAPRIKSEKWNDSLIRFGYTGVPLSQICVLFYPLFSKWISDFVEQYEDQISIVHDTAGNEVKLNNIKAQFNPNEIENLIKDFIKNIEGRFSSIKLRDSKGNKYPCELFYNKLNRYFTKMDLLYLAASDITKNKHVYVTRYPVESYASIYPSRITILTTHDVNKVELDDKYFENYPVIYSDYPAEAKYFIDTTIPHNSYLTALGGDYDGDTVSIRAVFSQEANLEAERLINSKTMFLNGEGKNNRDLGKESIQALYTLTKD